MSKIELEDYYKNLINIWKSGGPNGGPGGWAGYYYGIFSKIIKENNFKNCAEIGIGYGFHAKEILDNTSIEKLYLIDPMVYYPNDGFAEDVIKYGGFENLVNNIKIHLKEHENRYEWFRCPSLNVTNEQIPDESLDAVFIDGDHSYEAVTKDLSFWWKKLKKGGWMLGDDYDSCWPQTKKAVDDFVQKNNLKIEFLSKPDAVKSGYPIYKIVKTVTYLIN
jgi:hypothetical protein